MAIQRTWSTGTAEVATRAVLLRHQISAIHNKGHCSLARILVMRTTVASFPGRSHLQYLIAYSMQIWRGKAWEIWSHAVTSGRQMVDTWGRCPTVVIPVLCRTVPGAVNDGWYWRCLANALASSRRTHSTRKSLGTSLLPGRCLTQSVSDTKV